jgi:hypothetical protein
MTKRTLTPNLSLLAALAFLAGCASTTTVDDYRPTTEPIDIGQEERVAILGRRDAGHYETDRGFMECLANKMNRANFRVMTEEEFIDALYPWFEPRTAPKHLKRLKRLMQDPVIQDKVRQEKIRYLVWLDGEVESHGMEGAMSCGMGPSGAGCFGYTSWDKNAMFEAIVWDLSDLTEEARIRVDSEGTSYVIGIVAPIPLLTPVKSQACEGMGNQLRSYFAHVQQEVG